MSSLKIAIIGGGAAGYFAAITAAEANPSANVIIYEQSKRTLTKVKILVVAVATSRITALIPTN